ncbi:type VI secretion system tip protein VgrG [Candidatus Binatia bacterium]|nr:type VI secretion system tip protein VgrG [Candidatus Binatia bacterium]
MAYTQDDRLIAIDTPLGKDALLLDRMRGVEAISRPFRFELDLLSEKENLRADDLLGQRVLVRLRLQDGTHRPISGIVSRFVLAETDQRLTAYRMEVVPWLWLLTRKSGCRIFQEKTVPEIVEHIFKEAGFKDYRLQLRGSYAPRDYCVQYRETDFNFVSRLMEQYGIAYFFEHGEEKHTLVMADEPGAFPVCPGQSSARCATTGLMHDDDVVREVRIEHVLRTGKYALGDFNFETPTTSLLASVSSTQALASGYEVYDYPGEYAQRGEGDRLVRLRIQAEDAARTVLGGGGSCRAFAGGCRFELQGHDRRDANIPYLLTEVTHDASVGSAYRTGAVEVAESYVNAFKAIPFKVAFRPPLVTPRPVVAGSQTAIVVGPKGEEIHTDRFGRVKVQFHWDREGKYDEKSSCWLRVAQEWAGKRWGAVWLPRIGQEVVVKFIEGDPDRPIVVGRAYNAEHMPPYGLPAEQTRSALKSYSSKGGGGFNELRFEDKKGKEQLFVHAERQQDVRVKKDALEWVGRDRHLIVEKEQRESVKGDKHLRVRGDRNEQIDGSASQKIGMDLDEKVGMKAAVDAGMEIHLKAGMNVVIEGGLTVTLKAGGGFVVVGPAGVAISGTPILINSGGAAGTGSGASPDPPKAPKEADVARPGEKAKMPPAKTVSPQAAALREAARQGRPFCEKCAAAARRAALARGATPEEAEAAAQDAGLAGAERELRPVETEPEDSISPSQAAVLEAAAEEGLPFAEECGREAAGEETEEGGDGGEEGEEGEEGEDGAEGEPVPGEEAERTFVEIELVDTDGTPLPGVRYRIVLPDGRIEEGALDAAGRARIEDLDHGTCQVSFPDLPGEDWNREG